MKMDGNSRIVAQALCIVYIFIIGPSQTAIGHRDEHEVPVTSQTKPHGNKLLLILLDGMRYDTLDKNFPGIEMMKQNGVYSKNGLRPCFPSVSFTNYYCITTGLYAESHGMVGNDLYDVDTNRTFWLKDYPDGEEMKDPVWWNQAEPIWVTALKQKKRVKMVRWPGCEVKMRGFTPSASTCEVYTSNITASFLHKDIERVLTDLADDKLDFAGIYQEEPDHVQHHAGVWSINATAVVQELATAIEHMQQRAKMLIMKYDGKTKLKDVLDIMIVSDHGHMNLSDNHYINVSSPIIKPDDVVFMMDTGAVLQVWPKEGKQEKIYKILSRMDHLSVYRKEEIPEDWHFKNNDRISPLIGVADPGYYFASDRHPHTRLKSTHGFNNTLKEMAGVFLARGPHFKKNTTVPSLDNVQLYQIMCSILGISPRPNNGTWSTVKKFSVDVNQPTEESVSFRSVVITVIVALIAVVLITILVCGCHYFRQQHRTKQYRTLPTNIENEFEADELDL